MYIYIRERQNFRIINSEFVRNDIMLMRSGTLFSMTVIPHWNYYFFLFMYATKDDSTHPRARFSIIIHRYIDLHIVSREHTLRLLMKTDDVLCIM